MIRIVERILRKHLDDAVREYEKNVEMTMVSQYEILWARPDFEERQALARELIEVIRGIDISKLRMVPSSREAKEFMRDILPIDSDEDFIMQAAEALINWLIEGHLER